MPGAIAGFERDLLLERQREGVAKVRAEGKYRDRQPTARAKAAEGGQAQCARQAPPTCGNPSSRSACTLFGLGQGGHEVR